MFSTSNDGGGRPASWTALAARARARQQQQQEQEHFQATSSARQAEFQQRGNPRREAFAPAARTPAELEAQRSALVKSGAPFELTAMAGGGVTERLIGDSSSASSNAADEPDESGGGKQQQQPGAINCTKATKGRKSLAGRARRALRRAGYVCALLLLLDLIVFFWPLDERYHFQAKVAAPKPRPKFVGALARNNKLDELGERLWQNQFHAPESMAWTSDKRAFYTGVEGGFVLLVEPHAERWTIAARLNGRRVEDATSGVEFVARDGDQLNELKTDAKSGAEGKQEDDEDERPPPPPPRKWAKFCDFDVQLYGKRAEFEPSLVELSRCSRPLGIRLAPDNSRLYVMDPFSGLYRVELSAAAARGPRNASEGSAGDARQTSEPNRVVRLLDMTRNQVAPGEAHLVAARPERADQLHFGDDIAVDWGAEEAADVIYLTDCSRRWPVRHLLWLMLENDDSGRVLRFEAGARRLRELPANVAPGLESRALSFPNGLELTADKRALLVSDLNNRRILKHHLSGPRAGSSELLLHTAGFSDNIRRGLDAPDGTPTYWFACGCAVDDGRWELLELANQLPASKRLLVRWLHLLGAGARLLGQWTGSTRLQDFGLLLGAGWLKYDPYCRHGLVAQFNERGQVLRSLQGLGYASNFRLLSEAHQVPHATGSNNATAAASTLWLGSVYYSYLGRIELLD